jgi:hypothetical protein
VSAPAQTDPEMIEYFDNFAFDEVLAHNDLDIRTADDAARRGDRQRRARRVPGHGRLAHESASEQRLQKVGLRRPARERGRLAVLLEVDADRVYLIGVKITATEIIGLLTDLRAHVLDTARRPLPAIYERADEERHSTTPSASAGTGATATPHCR